LKVKEWTSWTKKLINQTPTELISLKKKKMKNVQSTKKIDRSWASPQIAKAFWTLFFKPTELVLVETGGLLSSFGWDGEDHHGKHEDAALRAPEGGLAQQ
jgi:hypothetical protein